MNDKKYELSIDPKIMELLGPSLYTNIYFILAELIANAYDADAHNVYIIDNGRNITVEDDGKGMSYSSGEINKYLKVAEVSRQTSEEALTTLKRKKMGRKGVGKLAALSVSENVHIKTISNGEKSGFILSRNVKDDNLLEALSDEQISFEKISNNGTSVVMIDPEYKLHKTIGAVKRNLLRIFPLVNKEFRIHIINGAEKEVIDDFDKEMISQLSTLITLGDDFKYLNAQFEMIYGNKEDYNDEILSNRQTHSIPIEMKNNIGVVKEYNIEISGWIGTYKTTKGRKVEMTDFPDNFISLYSNNKMGEFNILPLIGQNKLAEVYVVGQLHVDIFELTELPDMALSNRQGYKSEDIRYKKVIEFARNKLLPDILRMRESFVSAGKHKKKQKALEKQKQSEGDFRDTVESFKKTTSKNAASIILNRFAIDEARKQEIETIFSEQINLNSPVMGIKSVIDSQKKKILISQTIKDKDLADIVYLMLLFNNVPPEDIIYTNCDDDKSRIPEGDVGESGIYKYLRDFFVDSYSTQKMYVIFVTSHETNKSWGAITEVGAAWITQIEHKIFNVRDFRPEHPLDDETQWHISERDDEGDIVMTDLSKDIFSQKIEYICKKLGYKEKNREMNTNYLETLVKIK